MSEFPNEMVERLMQENDLSRRAVIDGLRRLRARGLIEPKSSSELDRLRAIADATPIPDCWPSTFPTSISKG